MSLVFAHRGSRGSAPENTLISFEEAVRVGSDGIELDVRQTLDKEIVVIHDKTIDRTTTGEGIVEKMTLQEIQSYDAGLYFGEKFRGETVPTLKQVLELLEKLNFKGILNIEIKTEKYFHGNFEKRVAKIVNERPLPFEIIYSSFNIKSLKLIRKYDKNNKRYLLLKDIPKNNKIFLKAQKNKIFNGIHSSLGKSIRNLEFLKKLDKTTRLWTINKEKDMIYCFKQDFDIITDYPKTAIKIRKELNEGELNINDRTK
ncbi:glycerophosphodiester phosphodiesterase family protein [Lagierella sp. ICN-221743]